MKIIELPKHHKTWIMCALPAGGFLVNVTHDGDSNVCYRPLIVHPGKDTVVMRRRGRFGFTKESPNAASHLSFTRISNTGQELKTSKLGKDGSLVPYESESIRHHPNPDFYGIAFEKLDTTWARIEDRVLRAATGVTNGGVVLWRRDNDQTITLDLPCETGQIAVSADGLTVIIGHKNTLTIIDNPLI